MRAVQLQRPGEVDVVDRPDPLPGPCDVVIEVTGAGMCATDVHIYDGQLPPTPYPIVPGHEFAGRVVAFGDEVSDHAVGQLIAADCTLACGACSYCRSGRLNLCTASRTIGDTVDGAFAEYVCLPADNVYAWPSEAPHEMAPLAEPLAGVVHGLDRLGAVLGATALVVGTGVTGAMAGHLLRIAGARTLHACDLDAHRRMRAGDWADETLTALYDDDLRYDVVVDTTGSASAIEQSIGALAPGGRFLLLGAAPPHAWTRISPYEVLKRELTLIGSTSKRYSFQPAVNLLATGHLDLRSLLEEPVPLGSYESAIDDVRCGSGMKQVLDPSR